MKSDRDNSGASSYGVVKRYQPVDEVDKSIEELSWNGYTIVPGILDASEVAEAKERLDAVYQEQLDEFGEEFLESVSELNIARMPLLYDPWFVTLFNRPGLLSIVRRILGEHCILQVQNGIINRPSKEHHQSKWHRDLPYQDWTSSSPLALGSMFCIDDFTAENGGTVVLPHSHRFPAFPSDAFAENHSLPVSASAGSVILFDAMLYHRAGTNESSSVRRGINHLFTIPLIKQQIDIPAALGERAKWDEETQCLLGFNSTVKSSVKEWRNRHK